MMAELTELFEESVPKSGESRIFIEEDEHRDRYTHMYTNSRH